ncbi:MAG: DUF2330 domain-containing protein, partial [Myxococcota bacterium]
MALSRMMRAVWGAPVTLVHDSTALLVATGLRPRCETRVWATASMLTWAATTVVGLSAFGCGDDDVLNSNFSNAFNNGTTQSNSTSGGGLPGTPAPPPASGPVVVHNTGVTPNYEYVVLSAENTDTLVEWLTFNRYNVSDNMRPVMDVYNGAGKFLAVKLRNAKGASRIAPIKMTFTSYEPMVPIQLTAVAAQSQMSILVFIVGDVPFVPRNYGSAPPRPEMLLYDGEGRTNYFAWVARDVAETGGHHFITESIQANPVLGQTFNDPGLPPQELTGAMVSRYYTRLSPQHMDRDPIFKRHPNAVRRSGQLDLSNNTNILRCNPNTVRFEVIPGQAPSACAFQYCGLGATCITDSAGDAGCICPEGEVAQEILGPDGALSVTCAPKRNTFTVTDEAAGVGTSVDPCNAYDCGAAGACVVKGGFPTCACAPGNHAQLISPTGGGVTCLTSAITQAFGPGAGPESGR